MEETPQSKRIRVVTGSVMLNFAYWVASAHPEIADIHTLSRARLLQLVDEFEYERPDLDAYAAEIWLQCVDDLKRGAAMYEAARKIFRRRR